MDEKMLYYNETEVTDESFRINMFFEKFFRYKYITLIKLSICIFIIIGTVLLDMLLLDKIVYIYIGLLGIVDTLQVKTSKPDSNKKLQYKFFDEHFQLNSEDMAFVISYDSIKYIIDTDEYYYLVILKTPVMLAKNGFSFGNKEEIKRFLDEKRRSKGEK